MKHKVIIDNLFQVLQNIFLHQTKASAPNSFMGMELHFITIMTAIIGSSATGGVLVWILNKSKMRAEIRKIDIEADSIILSKYEQLVARLENRVSELEAENQALMKEVKLIMEVNTRMEYKLGRISSLIGGVMDEQTKRSEPFRSILQELQMPVS